MKIGYNRVALGFNGEEEIEKRYVELGEKCRKIIETDDLRHDSLF